jgi:hypothetical protein
MLENPPLFCGVFVKGRGKCFVFLTIYIGVYNKTIKQYLKKTQEAVSTQSP